MRTDNLPTNLTLSSSLTSKTQDISLTNQLFGSSPTAESFDQVLNSQVKAREPNPAPRPDSQPREDRQEAKSSDEGGKRLPDGAADRLQARQQAEQRRQDESAGARQSDKNRADREQAGDQVAEAQRERQDRLSEHTDAEQLEEARRQDNSTQSEAESEQLNSEYAQQASAEVAQLLEQQQTGQLLQGEVALAGSDSSLETAEDVTPATVDSEIVVAPELLDSVGVMGEQSEGLSLSQEDLQALAELSEEERLALEAAAAELGKIEGEGFQELPADEGLAGVMSDTASDLPRQAVEMPGGAIPAAEAPKSAGVESAKSALTPSMSAAAAVALADGSDAEAGEFSSSDEGDGHEFPVFEPKDNKKGEPGALADKLQMKPISSDGAIATPVQERLAALAKALDKAAPDSVSQSAGKVTEQADTSKATPFQRSLEQVSRASGVTAKPFSTNIQAPLQSREWAGEVSQRLMMMVSSKLSSAQIHLNPRELGPIDVKVSMHQDQANVVFTSHAAPTRDALEQAMPRLRDMMEQNGVALGDVDVRDHDARESHERAGQDQHQGGSNRSQVADADEVTVERVIQQPVGLVDYYA